MTASTGQLHVEETVADGFVTRTYSVQNVTDPEAKVGDTGYSTVYDAFYAIDGTTDNKTIVLQKDVTNAGIVTNGTAVNAAGKTVATFDLNGKSIGIGSVAAGNNADYTLTIIDSSQDKTGTVTNSDASLFILALTGINDYSGSYTLKIQAGTWQFDPSNVVINGETHNLVDEGYAAKDNGDGTWTVGEVEYVAKIGNKKYTTLQGAFNAANDGDVVELLKDYDAAGEAMAGGTRQFVINKSITFDGGGYTLTTKQRGIGVGNVNGDVTADIDVTIKNVTVLNASEAARCIDTRGKIGSLTLEGVTLSTDGAPSGYTQPLTIGGNQSDVAYVTITNSTIQTNDDATAYYAIITFNPVNMTVTNSTIKGWANIDAKKADGSCAGSAGSVFNLDNCTLESSNAYSGVSNAFSAFMIEDNDVTINVTNSDIIITNTGDQIQSIVGYPMNNNLSGNKVTLGEGNKVKFVEPGNFSFAINQSENSKLTVTGGLFNVSVPEAFCAEGMIPTANTDSETMGTYPYTVKVGQFVAQIGESESVKKYETLEAAFAAANDGETIKLLADCSGNGIKVTDDRFKTGLTVDFDGHTYTVDGETVGSTGTATNAFQLKKGNKITFKGGTIYSEKAKFLIQNYSDLTLEGMTLTLDNANYTSAYTLSNNNGNVVIDGTTINANPAGGFAFDVCRYSSYPSVGVTVKGESVINGDVEVSASKSDAKDGFSLMLESGNITGNIVVDATARAAIEATPDKAVIKENDSFNQAAPAGFKWVSNNDETSTLTPMPYVAQIGDVKYWSLAEAVAAVPADGTETTITMIANEMINVTGYAVTIPATKNIILDLNGYQVVGTVEQEGTSALIRNLGTLTIKDSSDTNKDGSGTGKLMSGASPTWTWDGSDDYSGSYASNLIRNEKNLIVESGYLYNMSTGSAAYAIDNYSAGNVTINGGKVDAAKASAIRMFYVNGGSIIVNDGIIGHYNSDDDCTYCGIQVMSGTNVNVSVNGGTIIGNYAVYSNNTGGNINISGGTYDGYVGFAASVPNIEITGGAFNYWVGTWGDQTKFISGGIYAEEVDEEYIADGYILADNTDPETKDAYPYTVRKANYICAIGTTKYETLADAVAAAGTAETTITLLTDAATDGVISGDGVVVPSGSNITFNLNGLTYNVSGKTVGSSGTENQGFQLLKNSNITFKNGTLKATSPTAQFLIQNYSNLTLEDVNLDGTGLSGWAYALSNNCGTINLTGSTSITAKTGGRAFDTCKFGEYAIPIVNIKTTGVISGPIEATGGKLNIENGKFDVTWVTDSHYAAGDIQIKGGVFTAEVAEDYCAEGFVCTDNDDPTYIYTVKTKEEAGVFELIDGKVYPYLDYTEDKPAESVSYFRTFKSQNWQSLYIPFDINDVTQLTDKYEFAKVHMVAYETDDNGVVSSDRIRLYYIPIKSGKIYANKPYLIKLKNKDDMNKQQEIKVENTTLYKTQNINDDPMKCSTTNANYLFKGTYRTDEVKAVPNDPSTHFFGVGGGGISYISNNTLSSYRWYIKVDPKDVNYAKPTIEFVMGDEDVTGISNIDSGDKSEIDGYYTINGVRSEVPVRGMNIVKYKNGKTKKVMIK